MGNRKIKVCILRTAGTNCDRETAFAFSEAGASAEYVHVNNLINRQKSLEEYAILALPGGFTYGDDVAAGKILANELRYKLAEDLRGFIAKGGLIIGICNGFQILVKSGLLPGDPDFRQEASLINNDSNKFEDRWIYLSRSQNKCVWTRNLPEVIYLPVAHGEGKFITDKSTLGRLRKNGQIVFRYCDKAGRRPGYPDNPNGSQDDIAGICDETGRILGLMPHPERHLSGFQHPRHEDSGSKKRGDGFIIFKNGVDYAKRNI